MAIRRCATTTVLASALVAALVLVPQAAAAGTWQGPTALGGGIKTAPEVVSSAVGKYEVFAAGNNDKLWWKRFDGSRWLDWELLDGPNIVGKPTAVALGFTRIDVFAPIGGGSFLHRAFQDGRWFLSETLFSDIAGSADAAVVYNLAASQSPRIDLVGRGADGRLLHYLYRVGYDVGYLERQPDPGGEAMASDPETINVTAPRFMVVARDSQNHIRHRTYNPTVGWSGWITIPGGIFISTAAGAWANHLVSVFGQGLNGGYYQSTLQDGTWSNWEPLPGSYTSGPTAIGFNNGRIDVLGRGGNLGLWQTWNNG